MNVDLNVNLHPSHVVSTALTGTVDCELDKQGRPRLDRPYSATLTLPVDSLKCGNALQDREMRRRLDASRYPTITARVTQGEALSRGGRYLISARLALHGRTRAIESTVRLRVTGTTMTVDGDQVINVKDFGVAPPRLIMLRMEPEVRVRSHIVAELQEPTSASRPRG